MTDKKGYHRRKKKIFQHRQVCLGSCWQFTTAMIVKSDVTWAVDPRDASLLKRRDEGGGEDERLWRCGGESGDGDRVVVGTDDATVGVVLQPNGALRRQ